MLFGRFCERAYLYGTFGKPGRNWLHCQTNSILIRLYEICQCELDSWTCHPTNFGLIGHMQEKNRGGGAKLSMLAYVGCWSHCGSWSLSYTVVLSCVMEKTVCYHVLPVLTSRSCRSQEIIRGAIHWLRRVCVCVAIDGMHRIAIFNIHLYICMPCLMFMCICLLFDLFVYMRVRSEQLKFNDSMILNWRQGLADSHFLQKLTIFQAGHLHHHRKSVWAESGKKTNTRTNFRRNLLVCHRLLVSVFGTQQLPNMSRSGCPCAKAAWLIHAGARSFCGISSWLANAWCMLARRSCHWIPSKGLNQRTASFSWNLGLGNCSCRWEWETDR